jgi:RNA polymerase sigma factor (sigma-70 family)
MDTDPASVDVGWVESAYRNLAPEIDRKAKRLSNGDGELAQDLKHETFVGLLESGAPGVSDVEKKASGRHLLNWLLIVMRRRSVDHHRRSRYRQLDGDHSMEEIPDRCPGVHDQAVIREEVDLLRRIIDALPERQREVMRLRSLGRTNPEISELMGINAVQVARLASRSFAVVREAFKSSGLIDSVRRGKGRNYVDPR